MALQFSATVQDAMLDAIQYGASSGTTTGIGTSAILRLYSGAVPAHCSTSEGGTLIAEFDLASNWAANASGGAKALSGTPLEVAAAASGTLGHFRIYDSTGATCHMQGTITAGGGGGDLTVDNTNVAAGQNVIISGFTLNAPGA